MGSSNDLFVSQLLQSIGYNQTCSFVGYAGVTMRGSMVSAVYRKSLRLTSKARQLSTSGEMVNLMSNDAIYAFGRHAKSDTLHGVAL